MQNKISQKKIQLICLTPFLIITLSIFILSHQPQVPKIYFLSTLEDKVQHFIAFFTLGSSIQLFLISKNITFKKVFLMTCLLGSLYGVSDEFHQSFIVGRSVEVLD